MNNKNNSKDIITSRILKGQKLPKEEYMKYILSFALSDEKSRCISKSIAESCFFEKDDITAVLSDDLKATIDGEQRAFIYAFLHCISGYGKAMSQSCQLFTHKAAGEFFTNYIGNADDEGLYIAFLTEGNVLIQAQKIGKGDTGSIFIDVESIVNKSAELNAKKIIIAHNHTSEYISHSMEDYYATQKLESYLAVRDIELLEHFVINDGKYRGILYDIDGRNNWRKF